MRASQGTVTRSPLTSGNGGTVADYAANLRAMIQGCLKYGKTPVLVTPHRTALLSNYGSGGEDFQKVGVYVQAMRQVAREQSVELIDMWQRSLDVQTYYPPQGANGTITDGIHPHQLPYRHEGAEYAGVLTHVNTPPIV